MLLTISEVLARTRCSRSFIIAHVADGTMPAPLVLGPKKHMWLAEEIEQWIVDRAAARVSHQVADEVAA